VRHRVALVLAVSLLLGALVLQPAVSAVVIKGVSCSTCPSGSKWSPRSVSILQGTRVTWKAINTSHNVKSIGANWSKKSSINIGEATSFTFANAGTYRFRCTLHSTYSSTTKKCTGMCGKVVVS